MIKSQSRTQKLQILKIFSLSLNLTLNPKNSKTIYDTKNQNGKKMKLWTVDQKVSFYESVGTADESVDDESEAG